MVKTDLYLRRRPAAPIEPAGRHRRNPRAILAPVLSIQLLGPPQILLAGQALELTRRKSRALLYYLAAHTRPVTRDHLLAFFWPDTERASAQQILRTTLHGLRKALGPALVVEDTALSLAPEVEVDTRQFERHLASASHISDLTPASLATTLSLYQGDFLQDVTLPDTPAFENWMVAERERYSRLRVRGLTALSQHYEAELNFPAALGALDQALAADPLQEDVQRRALRLHYFAGDRAGAIRRYEQLRQLLDTEMGVPPMAETRAVYDAIINDKLEIPNPKSQGPKPIRRSPNPQPSPSTPQLPFIGREVELNAIRSAAGQLVLIEGEPGLGKTRLAEEFIHATEAIALIGAARELEQALPYHPFIEALRGLLMRTDWPALRAGLEATLPPVWLAEAARLLPELHPDSAQPPSTDESRLWEGVHQFLLALARQHPIIIFLDDLHWADASTLALLGYLIRRGGERKGREGNAQPALTFIAATRTGSPRSPLATLTQTLTREGRLQRLPLTRLDLAAITALAGQLCSVNSASLAEWLARASEGNPYILVELLRHAREQNLLRADGTFDLAALTASPIVPQSIYMLIQARLLRLSDAARRLLDAAVAIGREFQFEIAARAAALSETAALDALDEARTAGLIRPAPDDATGRLYEFDHTLTMEVAYREVGETRHRLIHRRVAEALESLYRTQPDAVAGLLATHFAEGHAPERAAPYAFRAGQLALSLAASTEAVAFFELAQQGETDSVRQQEIYLALGNAQMQAGAFAQASEAFRAAAALARDNQDEAGHEAAQLALGQSLLGQGRYSEILELAQSLLHSHHAASAEALWGTALSLEGADLAGASQHLQKAAALLRDESGPVDQARLGQVLFELGSIKAQQGDLPQAVSLYHDALALVESTNDPQAYPLRILAYNNLAYHLHLLHDPLAIEYAQKGLHLAQEKGGLGLQLFLLSTLGEIALAAAEVDTAEKYFADGLALAERLSVPERIAGLTANLGLVAVRRGQTASAIHRLSTALARADALGTQHLAAQIRVWLAPLLPPDEARTTLAEARAIAESGGRQRLLDEVEQLEATLGSPKSEKR